MDNIIYKIYAIVDIKNFIIGYIMDWQDIPPYSIFYAETDDMHGANKISVTDKHGCYLHKVIGGDIVQTTDVEKAEQYRPQVIARIKSECERVITSRYDNWTQINAERQGMRLLEKMIQGDLTAEETSTLEGIRQAGDWIDNIRAQSNAMELEVSTISYNDLLNYDIIFNEEITS